MARTSRGWWLLAITCFLFVAQPARAADEIKGNLVNVEWLQKNMHDEPRCCSSMRRLRALSKQSTSRVRSASTYTASVAAGDAGTDGAAHPLVGDQRRQKVVLYDQGASMEATWLFFELHYHGYPASDLVILDGGLAKWQAPGARSRRMQRRRRSRARFASPRSNEDHRVRLAEFLIAFRRSVRSTCSSRRSSPRNISAEPSSSIAPAMFPTRSCWQSPTSSTRTRRSSRPSRSRRMATYLGITARTQIHCALRRRRRRDGAIFRAQVHRRLSERQGLQGIAAGVAAATSARCRSGRTARRTSSATGLAQRLGQPDDAHVRRHAVNLVDVRTTDAYKLGHVPFALNVPAETSRSTLDDPRQAGRGCSAQPASIPLKKR